MDHNFAEKPSPLVPDLVSYKTNTLPLGDQEGAS